MGFPSDSYIKYNFASPTGTVTDNSILFAVYETGGQAEEDFFDSISDTSDVTKIHSYKDDGVTRLAIDIFEHNLTTAGSRYIIGRTLWSGSLTSTGSYTLRLGDGGTTTGVNDTYGQYNAYTNDVEGYYPSGGGNDRTGNQLNLTATGSPTITTGQIGAGYSYDGVDDGYDVDLTLPTSGGISFGIWVKYISGSYRDVLSFSLSDGSYWSIENFGNGTWKTPNTESLPNITFTSAITWQKLDITIEDIQGNSGQWKAYLNGVSIYEPIETASLELTQFSLGWSKGRSGRHIEADINEAYVSYTELSSTEIAYEYTQTSDNADFLGSPTWVSGSTAIEVTCTETTTMTDSGAVSALINTILSETANLADSATKTVVIDLSCNDGLQLTDISTATAIIEAVLNETGLFTDISTIDSGLAEGLVIITASSAKLQIIFSITSKPEIIGG